MPGAMRTMFRFLVEGRIDAFFPNHLYFLK